MHRFFQHSFTNLTYKIAWMEAHCRRPSLWIFDVVVRPGFTIKIDFINVKVNGCFLAQSSCILWKNPRGLHPYVHYNFCFRL